jgi:hypothetical protein
MTDLRSGAVFLGLVGILCGLFLPLYWVAYCTLAAIFIVAYVILRLPSATGTSDNLGVAGLLISGSVSYVLPMWVAFIVKRLT